MRTLRAVCRFGRFGAQLGFDPAAVRDAYRPRWNIAPTAAALVVESGAGVGQIGVGRVGRMVRWGGPAASAGRAVSGRAASGNAGRGGRPRFNIRAETVAGWGRRRGNDWGHRRCLVPANGFYEWQAGPGGRRTPWWFQPADGGVMVMAGIRFGADADAGEGASYAVVTCPANGLVEPVHHRMPVVLEAGAVWRVAGRSRGAGVSAGISGVAGDDGASGIAGGEPGGERRAASDCGVVHC